MAHVIKVQFEIRNGNEAKIFSLAKIQQKLISSVLSILNLCLPTGEALLESNTVIHHIYCSPSLRCVQTAHHILKGKSLGGWILISLWPCDDIES